MSDDEQSAWLDDLSSDSPPPETPDSPPYRHQATRDDVLLFWRQFPRHVVDQQYVHFPNRRVSRVVPNHDNIRQCWQCSKIILPYRPGKCPSCWRTKHTSLPAFALALNICVCACRCPPEPDEPADQDYEPNTSDEEQEDIEMTEDPEPTSEVLAASSAQDFGNRGEQRLFYAEHSGHYVSAIQSQPEDIESSSFVNNANTISEDEASVLHRLPFRLELAALLGNGYSRDQLRMALPETQNKTLTCYLPPDRPQYEECPVACNRCKKDYPPMLRDAITIGMVEEEARRNLDDEHAPNRIQYDLDFLRSLRTERDRPPVVRLCTNCGFPIRGRFEYRDRPGMCLCRCECSDPRSSDGSSSSESNMIG